MACLDTTTCCVLLGFTKLSDSPDVRCCTGVEQELAGLQLDLKLTSGPKKSALELLRKKIELQNDNVVLARGKHNTAKKVCCHGQSCFATKMLFMSHPLTSG